MSMLAMSRRSVPSNNGCVDPFAATAGALVGACFPSLLGWCRHHDSHLLRAPRAKRWYPSFKTDYLIRPKMLHGHDDLPPRNPSAVRLGPVAESRLYKIALYRRIAGAKLHAGVLRGLSSDRSGASRSAERINSSTRHCSLTSDTPCVRYRQAMACPSAAQKPATYRSPGAFTGSTGAVGRHDNTQNRAAFSGIAMSVR